MAKRSTNQPKKRRDRKSGLSPYQKYGKTPWPYSPELRSPGADKMRKG